MDTGTGPSNNAGGWRSKSVADKKQIKLVTGSKEVRIASPLFVPATKDGVLASRLKLEEEKLGNLVGWKYKIVERSGRTIRDMLVQADVFKSETCGREGCGACECASKPLNCRKRGIMYETSCLECMV